MTPAGDKIARAVESYIGCSPNERPMDLALLVSRGVDDPMEMLHVWSNCGTFALGIFHQVGVDHPLLSTPYKSGMAIAWLLKIGRDLGALVTTHSIAELQRGMLMHFSTPGKNDDHVEFCLSDIDSDNSYRHAGGGHGNDSLTVGEGVSNLATSMGRPLQHLFDPTKLLPKLP